MPKSKQQRTLFELLARNRAQDQAQAEAHEEPVIRPYGQAADAQGGADVDETGASAWTAQPFRQAGRVTLTYYQLAIALVVVGCLCALFYFLGVRSGPPLVLPESEDAQTFEATRNGPVVEDLVSREGERADPNQSTRQPEESGPTEGETPAETATDRYRLRIARLDVARSEYTDRLRVFLAGNGVETDLEARGGYYYLYSRARFDSPDGEKMQAFLKKVADLLETFERETGWPAATNPYPVSAD